MFLWKALGCVGACLMLWAWFGGEGASLPVTILVSEGILLLLERLPLLGREKPKPLDAARA